MTMPEEWRDIAGFEGRYQVSNTGLVRGLDRYVENNGGQQFVRGQILKQHALRRGHCTVYLRGGIRANDRRALVHRLVLESFVGPCPEGWECCHNDGDPTNNRLENLRWDTRSNNGHDRVRHGNHLYANKTHCPQGHEYTEANISWYRGRRNCRICHNQRSNERYRRLRQQARQDGAA